MKLLYDLAVGLMAEGIRLASTFNPKARLWVEGRRDIFRRLQEAIDPTASLIWFHAASLGEFEQGRPLIEAFRQAHPDYKILVTFYSPSGYEIRKNYPGADYIFYLPSDTPSHVRQFMKIVRPRIAVFIKYEFWVNYLLALQRAGVHTYLISAIFRPGQSFFRWYGSLMRRALRVFDELFVQNEESKRLLAGIGIQAVTVTGDTRFDRVYAIARAARELPPIARFAAGSRVLVAGSTWPPDEELLLKLIRDAESGTKFIIAPHEIEETRIRKMAAQCSGRVLRYTELQADSDLEGASVLIIDTVGILSSVYRYGRWAYIGGGFGVGIHNILEAATFGLPLAFGPRYEKFQEARELIQAGGARSISDFEGLFDWFRTMDTDPECYERSSSTCRDYVLTHKGATEQIMRRIDQEISASGAGERA